MLMLMLVLIIMVLMMLSMMYFMEGDADVMWIACRTN